MNYDAIYKILKDVFTTYHYHVGVHPFELKNNILVAEKDDDRLLVMHSQNGDYYDVERLIGVARDQGGRGLLVTIGSFALDACLFAEQNNILLWDRGELEKQIGKAALANICGKDGFALQDSVSNFFGLDAEQGNYIPQLPLSDESCISYGIPTQKIDIQLRSLSVHITRQNAVSIANSRVGQTESAIIVFTPFWQYHYKISLVKQYKSRTVDLSGDGTGVVNALVGENKFVQYERARDRVSVPDENYRIESLAISQEEAQDIAIQAIIKKHTKRLRINEMVGEAIIFENKSFKPRQKDISIELDLIHIPIWNIRGKTGSIKLNAHDGHILTEVIDSDAEFV
ncbi:MAG: hypothetical protein BME93_01190 [Methanosarcinales archaeon Met12]|nr:MAG: hypothetical protein BME93_01190 [Methanosarcinales archaeon Met12]